MGDLTEAEVRKMKVVELKSALNKRNLPAAGTKATLVDRLLDFLTVS